MIILPAIDIQNGQCVRLTKGDFATVEKVAEDPLETALDFQNQGAAWIHMVDLDGAKEGSRINSSVFLNVARNTGLKVELGGGIRTMESIDYYIGAGISRVILGSAAISDPELVKTAVEKYADQIAIGIDARNEMVSGQGWLNDSSIHYLELAKRMESLGVQYMIYTDISKDGTLSGPNLTQLSCINEAVSCKIIASGGIHTMEDIKALEEMGLYGAICGKSIYKGTLSLKEAVEYCRKKESGKE
ncbi:1-(5-phosphoribosyl)-5-[(5-phosphoribosylamino)methylideneamino]imidazole-4-carboxamide isomerase [Sinanaerobacter chloroacetimidivorans]|uniref:1-(5-phosphoribosyl)-5-[(5-phosphoribosylamino)methylideneamino] imidazole-4-carboxamide isomerase n=1 Tax=Sinanaerobacter chloroacetimidivorans TaxID=2818044 RepID=A0A8J7W1G8_9FIRM|nr:1-(5-phosphoribosyl)-5-[(5-phosphoribosylamino)methylideneamino]imidazole-4-carboxamide isomerase [Sinanaerobacter chloroacetimidivorans]MBR0599087.1 1-(5-phosphoribosyl)-5-[(5-phosphoribosylamino)methylideneamino]imidazole-4-carboxamide isomerase [Sinanaerobacter chloroacetimidivorans]